MPHKAFHTKNFSIILYVKGSFYRKYGIIRPIVSIFILCDK